MLSHPVLRIDEEFRAYIPPLSEEERQQLEENIVAEGCLDPIVVWGDVIVDGHNRYEICTRRGVHFDVVQRFFSGREAALDWMDAHQLGRRNLSPDARKLLLGRRYNRLKGSSTDNLVQNAPKCHFDTSGGSTAERLAKEHGVSPITVKRAGKFAEQVDADPALKAAVASGVPLPKLKPKLAVSTPIPANDPQMSTDERKLRRKLSEMTTEGLIDEVVGLSLTLAETKAKLKKSEFEREGLKARMAEFLSAEGNEVIRRQAKEIERLKSEAWRAKENASAHLRRIYVLEREAKKGNRDAA